MQKKSRKSTTPKRPQTYGFGTQYGPKWKRQWFEKMQKKEYRKKAKKLHLQIKNKSGKHQNVRLPMVPTRPKKMGVQGTNANGRKLLTQVYRKKAKKLHLQTKKKLAKQRKKTKQKQTRTKLARNLLKTRKGEAMLRKAKALHRQ